jgi:hypothetical protein
MHHCAQYEKHFRLAQKLEKCEEYKPRPRKAEDEQALRNLRKDLQPAVKTELTLGKAITQWQLACRELKEAIRLRPHDDALKVKLKRLRAILKKHEEKERAPMMRFSSHFNLAIRYWDMGKGRMAMREMLEGQACLREAGKSAGCTQCCLQIMEHLTSANSSREARCRSVVKERPRSVAAQYALGVVFFDKRMLQKAETQFTAVRELALFRKKAAVERAVRKGTAGMSEGYEAEDFEGVEDDLAFVKELKDTLNVQGTYTYPGADLGERAFARLVPCLQQRFTGDLAPLPSCQQWADNLYADRTLDWGD